MAFKPLRTILTFNLILILFTNLLPSGAVQALGGAVRLPVLNIFISQVRNGQADELRGVYIPGVLAAHVVQQPAGDIVFVSTGPNVVTQFGPASQLGSTGLLAHNYLAGERFTLLAEGQEFFLIYGDGHISAFVVTEILRYQALEPTNIQSEFVDLENGGLLSAAEVFGNVYNRPGQVIFQTCISADGNASWGRLFVVAESYYNKKYSPSLAPADIHQDSALSSIPLQ